MNSDLLEKSILATMLSENYLITDSNITAQHFIGTLHRTIYQTMKSLLDKGQPVDAITLITEAGEALGDLNYIASLEAHKNTGKFDAYVEMLKVAYQKRETNRVLQTAISEGWELEQIVMELNKVETHSESDAKTAYEMALEISKLPFEKAASRKGIQTGLKQFDLATGGLVNDELVIIAARPSIGKTALMINLAIASQTKNKNVLALIFSLEMSNRSIAERFACNIGNINQNYLKSPESFTEGKKTDWIKAMGQYSEMNVISYDKPAQAMSEIRGKVRKAARENPGMQVVVFIDYLTLISPADKKANSHTQVTQISKDLKNMAREFKIPVCCLAQLNRDVEKRENKRPMLSDLRESGSIEQDADIVALLYRDSYYLDNKKDDKTLEINIAKNRSGSTGTVFTTYHRATGVIEDANNQPAPA